MFYFLSWGVIWLIVAVTFSAFIKNPTVKVGVILFAALFIKFRPGFDPENIAFLISSLSGAIAFEKLPFDKRVNLFSANLVGLILLLFSTNFIR